MTTVSMGFSAGTGITIGMGSYNGYGVHNGCGVLSSFANIVAIPRERLLNLKTPVKKQNIASGDLTRRFLLPLKDVDPAGGVDQGVRSDLPQLADAVFNVEGGALALQAQERAHVQ